MENQKNDFLNGPITLPAAAVCGAGAAGAVSAGDVRRGRFDRCRKIRGHSGHLRRLDRQSGYAACHIASRRAHNRRDRSSGPEDRRGQAGRSRECRRQRDLPVRMRRACANGAAFCADRAILPSAAGPRGGLCSHDTVCAHLLGGNAVHCGVQRHRQRLPRAWRTPKCR